MNKEKYERTGLDIYRFQTKDILTTSGYDDNEGWNPYTSGGSGGEGNEGWNPH